MIPIPTSFTGVLHLAQSRKGAKETLLAALRLGARFCQTIISPTG
jgi:hypothetical protein